MSQRTKSQPPEKVPVHFPRPGERYVRVEDLMRNEGVRDLIRKMAEIRIDPRSSEAKTEPGSS